MSVSIGISGTRSAMTTAQKKAFRRTIEYFAPMADALRHGDCIGADEFAHGVALGIGLPVIKHPGPTTKRGSAHCQGALYTHSEAPYLKRNGHIAAHCDLLIAAPAQSYEVTRSGTWSTVRRARLAGKPIVLVLPDGTVKEDSNV